MSTTISTRLTVAIVAWLAGRPEPIWLVGGVLRDSLAGQPAAHDLDIVVDGDALAFAHELAAVGAGTAALLDAQAGTVRVTFAELPGQCDITRLAASTIEGDLVLRDFTLNALALPLTPAVMAAALSDSFTPDLTALIDPLGGLADLQARRLRPAGPQALRADPVRILRGARIATRLDLTFDTATLSQAHEAAAALADVAPERIATEMLAMLAAPHARSAMQRLDALGALTVVVPPLQPCRGVTQGTLHYWDVFEHTLAVIHYLDELVALIQAGLTTTPSAPAANAEGRVEHPTALVLGGHNADLLAYLAAPLLADQTRLTMLKLAALFHDVGKPMTRNAEGGRVRFPGHPEAGVAPTAATLQWWRLGRRARRYVENVVHYHMRPAQLADEHGLSDRALRHFFRDAGPMGLEVALFSLADHLAVYGPTLLTPFWIRHYGIVDELVRRFYDDPHHVIPARLIDGNDLMIRYGLQPGPDFQGILAQVHEARLDGTISTRDEAFQLVDEMLGVDPHRVE